jgi:hypothetical protein
MIKELTLKNIIEGIRYIANSGAGASIQLSSKNCKCLSEKIEKLQKENKRLNNIINKSIEYIENNNLYEETILDYDIDDEPIYWDCDDKATNDLLSILRGEE